MLWGTGGAGCIAGAGKGPICQVTPSVRWLVARRRAGRRGPLASEHPAMTDVRGHLGDWLAGSAGGPGGAGCARPAATGPGDASCSGGRPQPAAVSTADTPSGPSDSSASTAGTGHRCGRRACCCTPRPAPGPAGSSALVNRPRRRGWADRGCRPATRAAGRRPADRHPGHGRRALGLPGRGPAPPASTAATATCCAGPTAASSPSRWPSTPRPPSLTGTVGIGRSPLSYPLAHASAVTPYRHPATPVTPTRRRRWVQSSW
jgi:hypothetical protein